MSLAAEIHLDWIELNGLKVAAAKLAAQQAYIRKLRRENERLRAIAEVDNERLVVAAKVAGIAYLGCDTPEWLADEVVALKARIKELEGAQC